MFSTRNIRIGTVIVWLFAATTLFGLYAAARMILAVVNTGV